MQSHNMHLLLVRDDGADLLVQLDRLLSQGVRMRDGADHLRRPPGAEGDLVVAHVLRGREEREGQGEEGLTGSTRGNREQ